jgi:hypothetical protein
MRTIHTFNDFLNEAKETNDLHKVYLAYDPDLGHRFWSYKDFAADKFFIRLTPENYKDIEINKDFPVLTYNSKVVQTLLDKNLIKAENVYNKPEFIVNSGSKAEFHKIVDGDENIPKTCLKTEDAIKEVGFPMIAKPTEGHSGLGITVIKNQEDFDAADHNKLDVYSQYIDKKSEHRFFTFKGKPFFWQERKPTNDKAKTGDGDGKERMMFDYIKKDVSKTPEKFNTLIAKFGKIFSDLPYICFDIMEDQDGKLYIIESNSMPGVPFDSTVDIYRVLFEDFYGRSVDAETNAKLKELAKYMIDKSAKLDGGDRFTVEK